MPNAGPATGRSGSPAGGNPLPDLATRAAPIRAGGLMNEKNGAESGNGSEFPDTYYLSVSDRVIVDAAAG